MKKRTIVIVSLLGLTAVAAFAYLRRNQNKVSVSLTTTRAQYGYIAQSVTATGNIQPVDTVIVGAQVSGVIKAVYTDYNNPVKQGQLLAKVDPSIINAQIDEAKATLMNAQSNLEFQRHNFNRQQQLYNLGAISKADYQLATNQYHSAQASVNNAAALLKVSQRNLFYTNIYSPINGVVLNKNISAGQTIASSFNAPTLFVLAKDLSKIQVNADVDEADIGGVRPSQHVTFTVDAFPDEVFSGTVQKIYLHPSISANVVTYPTLINIDNSEMKLRPGMTASITIYIQEDSTALLIPTKALNFKPDSVLLKNYVWKRGEKPTHHQPGNHISNTKAAAPPSGTKTASFGTVWTLKGDTLTEKRIRTGMNDGSNVEVLHGLSVGEAVITGMTSDSRQAAKAQRSPFMPQMPRRSTGGQGQRNQ